MTARPSGSSCATISPNSTKPRPRLRPSRSASPTLQGPPQIAGSVQHTDDFRPVIQRTIKDDVPTEGQAAQPWHKLIAGPAHKRMCGEQLTMLPYCSTNRAALIG